MSHPDAASPSSTAQWAFGRELERRRNAVGFSKRHAASRAGISESRWRQLEVGVIRISGVEHPTNPKSGTIIAAAKAVDWSPAHALQLAGIEGWEDYQDATQTVSFNDVEKLWKQLTETQKESVLHVMAAMADPTSPISINDSPMVPSSLATAEERGSEPRVSTHFVPKESTPSGDTPST